MGEEAIAVIYPSTDCPAIGPVIGMAEGRVAARREEWGMIIATTGSIAGQRITATLGHVIGVAVRTRGLEGNIMAGLANIGTLNGDAMAEYHDALLETRDAAIARMAERAAALGANAVLGLRFDAAAVGHDMGEVVAYGTAVVVEPDAPMRP